MSNVDLARSIYDAFGQGDIPAVLGVFDPDLEWREAEGNPYQPDGSPFRGGDEVLQKLFMRLGTEWETFTVQPKEFHDAGDTVVVEGRYTGTHKETGNTFDAQFCHVLRIRDDKLTSFQQYTDTAQMQKAMQA